MYSIVYDSHDRPALKLETDTGFQVTLLLNKSSVANLVSLLETVAENIERSKKREGK